MKQVGFWNSKVEILTYKSRWDIAERIQVIRYLRDGTVTCVYPDTEPCLLGCRSYVGIGCAGLTDGSWEWPENLIHYVDCKDRWLYRLRSRNLRLGVFNIETGGFCGMRTKFNSTFVFEEYHVDYDGSFKTAAPMELLEEMPAGIEAVECFKETLCAACGAEVEWRKPEMDQENARMNPWIQTKRQYGQWIHLNTNECTEQKPTVKHNKLLATWLRQMELKYPGPDLRILR